jgi:two-component system nitrate/nitrite response regulator NarL
VDISVQSESENISVLVAEATAMGGELVASALKRCRRKFRILGPAYNCADAFHIARDFAPDVAVISTQLEDGPLAGFKVLNQIRSASLATSAIMLTDVSEPDLVIDSIRGGARGIFCRCNSLKSLSKCIRTVHSGQLWFSNEQTEFVFELIMRFKPLQLKQPQHMKLLTKREAEVVRLVSEGMRNSDIASELNLAEHTVRNYIFRIFEKLGLSSRVELALYGLAQQQLTEHPTLDSYFPRG